jgi:uncharacterized protein (TIGR02271 family)
MAEINQQTYSTVVGYFPSEQSAESAVNALQDAGFTPDQIGVAARTSRGFTPGMESTGSDAYNTGKNAGNAASGFWGSIKNLLEGPVEPYADERERGDLANREITNEYDYDSGDFHQSLSGMSLPEHRSRYFSQLIGSGDGVLVTVNAGGRRVEAERILQSKGADLGNDAGDDYSNEVVSSTYAGDPNRADRAAYPENTQYQPASESEQNRGAADVAGQQRIQLYGEVLRVHRDRVQRGEVRLRKEVVTETQTVQVPVTREELVVERVPVSGEQTAPGANIGEDSEIRIPLSEERVSVEKQPVVREEVQVGKREITNVESRDEQVRREELRVDDDTQRKAS